MDYWHKIYYFHHSSHRNNRPQETSAFLSSRPLFEISTARTQNNTENRQKAFSLTVPRSFLFLSSEFQRVLIRHLCQTNGSEVSTQKQLYSVVEVYRCSINQNADIINCTVTLPANRPTDRPGLAIGSNIIHSSSCNSWCTSAAAAALRGQRGICMAQISIKTVAIANYEMRTPDQTLYYRKALCFDLV